MVFSRHHKFEWQSPLNVGVHVGIVQMRRQMNKTHLVHRSHSSPRLAETSLIS